MPPQSEVGRSRLAALPNSAVIGFGALGTALALWLCAWIVWPWYWLLWAALVPWLAAVSRQRSWRGAAAAGVAITVIGVLMVFSWLPTAVQDYTGASWSVCAVVVALLAPIIEPQFIVYATVRQAIAGNGAALPWRAVCMAAAAYVGTEWVYPRLFDDTLGYGLYGSVYLRQAADIFGGAGLTFCILLVNECVLAVAAAVIARRWRAREVAVPVAVALGILAALGGYGLVRYQQFTRPDTSGAVRAALVQADLSKYDRMAAEIGTYRAVQRILDAHFVLSTQALHGRPIDLLIWPETVYPTTFGVPKSADGAAFDRTIIDFARGAGVPLIFGSYDIEGGHEFNAAFFLDGSGPASIYRKASLFPLTEHVPALLDSALVRGWLPWMGTWTAGASRRVVPLPLADGRRLRIAPMICYDALIPEHALAAAREGADLIVTLSNDSWFTYGRVPQLILLMAAFRSIETRRPQFRATNTGVSAIISPSGDVLDSLGVHAHGTLIGSLSPDSSTTTLRVAWGEWFGPAVLMGAAAAALWPALRRRR